MDDELVELLSAAITGRRVKLTEEVAKWEGNARPGMMGTVAFVANCDILPLCVDTDSGQRFFCRPNEVELLPLPTNIGKQYAQLAKSRASKAYERAVATIP